MSFKDVVDDLLGIPHKVVVPTVAYPETAQDGGKPNIPPNSDPKYFQPEYPSEQKRTVGNLPPADHPDHEWLTATKQGKFIPYVGSVDHGVEIDVDPSMIPVNDIDLTAARGHGYGTPVGAAHVNPVPVVVVDTPSFFGIEKRITTNVFNLATSTPVRVAARRPERNSIQLNFTNGTGSVQIGATVEQVVSGVGFIMLTNRLVTLSTNQEIWAITDGNNVVVTVLEEYTVVEGQKRF